MRRVGFAIGKAVERLASWFLHMIERIKRSFRAVFGRSGHRAMIRNRTTVIYRENGRRMTIAGEMLSSGFEIYVASIVAWDDSDGELIDEAERARIVGNVRSSLEAQGEKIVLN